MTQQKLTLVLGGTGKTGRRVATREPRDFADYARDAAATTGVWAT